jgi:ADP-ribose pyrophosphatase YjhB (NUDIX family)
VAIGILKQGDDFLLQHRDFAVEKGGAGLYGCFGGKIEPGEQSQEAVSREINEETTLQTVPTDFTHLGSLKVRSDHNRETITVQIEVFAYRPVVQGVVEAREGELVRLPRSEVPAILAKMTSGTRAAFQTFIIAKEK